MRRSSSRARPSGRRPRWSPAAATTSSGGDGDGGQSAPRDGGRRPTRPTTPRGRQPVPAQGRQRRLPQDDRRVQQAVGRAGHAAGAAGVRRRAAQPADPALAGQVRRVRRDGHRHHLDGRVRQPGLDPGPLADRRAAQERIHPLDGRDGHYEGKYWALPHNSNAALLYYRTDQVDKAPPRGRTSTSRPPPRTASSTRAPPTRA